MSKWGGRDRREFWRIFAVGETLAQFDDGLHALAAASRGDDTPVPTEDSADA